MEEETQPAPSVCPCLHAVQCFHLITRRLRLWLPCTIIAYTSSLLTFSLFSDSCGVLWSSYTTKYCICSLHVVSNDRCALKPFSFFAEMAPKAKFRQDWLLNQEFQPWLTRVEGDSTKAFCNACKRTLGAEITSIKRQKEIERSCEADRDSQHISDDDSV
ncbi:hypothetical protein Pcinc_008354 [Petrolisthes cinctipes]|uniref:Uncharacterized protein n=1 Tax=Petrolisthes cinctipes TaxID=88211 RepID=A0AAE1G9G8_PETCI|nr:hypothetical protein Pcinc_010263 [Petrolisthes cinctipes]KAK3887537.1 hypothetical protein Pcinc_008354 [Petrolisthes cinctipes]